MSFERVRRLARRYRLLLVVYGIAIGVGIREYVVAQRGEGVGGAGGCEASAAACFSISSRAGAVSDSAFWSQHAEIAEVVARLNPGDPDTYFLRGMQALAEGSEDEFARRFEEALGTGVKHNHFLLQFYAQYLLERGANWMRVNHAMNRWRENHPFSPDPISLRLAEGPSDPGDEAVLRRVLAEVPWIAGSQLQRREVGGAEEWRVLLEYRPGEVIDMREAVAAVTILALPPRHRGAYEVTCETLQDCRARRRR